MKTLVKKSVLIALLACALTLSTWRVILPASSAGNTVLSFSPAQASTPFPQPVTLNVTVSNVANLNGWQVRVTFNPSVLVCSNVTVPSDNLLGPSGGWLNPAPIVFFDNTLGYLTAFLALDGTQVVSGTGTLCQLTFNVSRPSVSAVTFANVNATSGGTVLYDANLNEIPFSTLDGNVTVTASGFQLNTFSAVKKGVAYSVGLFTNSTVSNFLYNETTDKMTFLLSGLSGTFGSCTASIPKALMNGTLAVLVNASVPYFTWSQDSVDRYLSFSYSHRGSVTVLTTLLGDLNGDRKIDIKDIFTEARAFGSTPGSPRWNPLGDVNGDLKIDIKDLSYIARNFGRTYKPS